MNDRTVISENETPESPEKLFRLLDKVRQSDSAVVRDDQYEFLTFMDAARFRGRHFGLIDSGRFSGLEMESLGRAGVSFYSSDEARTDSEEIVTIRRSCAKGGSFLAYFLNGELAAEGAGRWGIDFPSLVQLAESGVYMHLSNRNGKRDESLLADLGSSCRKGGSWLVYYHHGPLRVDLSGLARTNAWIHLSDRSLEGEEEMAQFRKLARRGKRLVLFVESIRSADFLQEMRRAGVFLRFMIPPAEPGSALAALENKARKKTMDPRAYYISNAFIP